MPYKYRTNFVYLFRLKHQDIMATINFLYRSTKDEANLILRLLFRHDGKDNVLAVNTKYSVSKHYWTKQHDIKKPKELAVVNKQHEVAEELNKIEKCVLTAFNSVSIGVVNKQWLQNQMDLYYNPPVPPEQLPNDLIGYFDKYLDFKKNEITPNTKKKINVIKQLFVAAVRWFCSWHKSRGLTPKLSGAGAEGGGHQHWP